MNLGKRSLSFTRRGNESNESIFYNHMEGTVASSQNSHNHISTISSDRVSTSIPPRGVLLQDWSTRVSSSGGDLKGSDQDGTSDDDPQSTTTMTQSFQEIPPPPLTSSSRRWDQFDTDNLEQESWRVVRVPLRWQLNRMQNSRVICKSHSSQQHVDAQNYDNYHSERDYSSEKLKRISVKSDENSILYKL